MYSHRLTVTYVPSAAIEMILTSQCPFELFCKIYPVRVREYTAIKFDKADNISFNATLNGTQRCGCFHRLA